MFPQDIEITYIVGTDRTIGWNLLLKRTRQLRGPQVGQFVPSGLNRVLGEPLLVIDLDSPRIAVSHICDCIAHRFAGNKSRVKATYYTRQFRWKYLTVAFVFNLSHLLLAG